MKSFHKYQGNIVKARATIIILLFAAVIICGCSAAKRHEGKGRRDALSGKDYQTAFKTWTREGRIYDGLDVKLISSATYLSRDFRQAFALEYANLYRLTDLEKQKFVQDQDNAGAAYDDFIFAAYVPEKQWDDFHKKNSIWKIFVTAKDGEQIKPVEVRRLDKRDAKTGHFYSYVTPWKSIYRLRFPKRIPGGETTAGTEPTDSFKLVLTSVLGSVEMLWDQTY